MPDHIHILFSLKPSSNISDLVREIKKSTNSFINESNFINNKFNWQEGFGSFSYGHRELDHICNYIRNQKEHHKKITFKEEYYSLLKEANVDFNPLYLFNWEQEDE
jgi:REP element-mobilizing transposase RayT